MPIYSYKAVDSYGKVVRGTLPAQTEAELESKLKQSNLDPFGCVKLDPLKLRVVRDLANQVEEVRFTEEKVVFVETEFADFLLME